TRINGFLDPQAGDSYQVDRSIDAFMNGGLWGRGPGEGTVKLSLPDAHADFVFAVAGEELGLIVCLIIVASALHLMPTKGMTLPFISYGGSSLLALGLGMGMILAFTRRRFGDGD